MDEVIRFHLDAHIDPRVADALRRRGIDVTTANEMGLRAAEDQRHWEFARDQRRVIVTKDADFIRFAIESSDHAGVVSCRRRSVTLRGIIEGLILIHGVLTPEEMAGHIEFL